MRPYHSPGARRKRFGRIPLTVLRFILLVYVYHWRVGVVLAASAVVAIGVVTDSTLYAGSVPRARQQQQRSV